MESGENDYEKYKTTLYYHFVVPILSTGDFVSQ
jgi:hypothetical protein